MSAGAAEREENHQINGQFVGFTIKTSTKTTKVMQVNRDSDLANVSVLHSILHQKSEWDLWSDVNNVETFVFQRQKPQKGESLNQFMA